MHYLRMEYASIQDRVQQARAILRAAGITQEQAAAQAGCTQSQVSRILQGKIARETTTAVRLCIYAENVAGRTSGPPSKGRDAIDLAVAQVWDGSESHAHAVADLLNAVARLRDTQGASS